MDPVRLKEMLEQVRSGELPIDEAMIRLRDLPYEDLGFAKLDHHRELRNGFPEVIYCPGKSLEHIITITGKLRERSRKVLATRATPDVAEAVLNIYPDSAYHTEARIIVTPGVIPTCESALCIGSVAVLSAGTADIPVAEEAVITAQEMGSPVDRMYDVGVAGIHRLLDQRERLLSANVIIVVAGMEGALASVVGGLVNRPVVAVPTSVGYGASFGGLAALLAMLNCCASGVAVMNIDNGFGAGYFAHMINLRPKGPMLQETH